MATCSACGNKVLVSKESSWAGTRQDGKEFLLCRACFPRYSEVFRDTGTVPLDKAPPLGDRDQP